MMRESVEARKLENRNVSLGNMSVPMDLSKDKNTQAAKDAMTFRVLVRKGNKPQVYPSPVSNFLCTDLCRCGTWLFPWIVRWLLIGAFKKPKNSGSTKKSKGALSKPTTKPKTKRWLKVTAALSFCSKGYLCLTINQTELFGGIPVVHVQKGARLSQKARKQQEQRPAPVGKPAGRAASSPAQHPQHPQQYQPFYPQNYQHQQSQQQQQQPPQNAGGRGDGFSGGYFVEPRRKR